MMPSQIPCRKYGCLKLSSSSSENEMQNAAQRLHRCKSAMFHRAQRGAQGIVRSGQNGEADERTSNEKGSSHPTIPVPSRAAISAANKR